MLYSQHMVLTGSDIGFFWSQYNSQLHYFVSDNFDIKK